jgi:hypothetical protein
MSEMSESASFRSASGLPPPVADKSKLSSRSADNICKIDDAKAKTSVEDADFNINSISPVIEISRKLTTHEELVRKNSIRKLLLSQRDVNYDSAAADRLMAIHLDRKKVLGVSWHGARTIFDMFENLTLDACRDLWNLTVPTEWMNSREDPQDINPLDTTQYFTLSKSPAPMWWIVENIVVPQTISSHESLLFLLFGLTVNSFPIVGVASLFHSYTWSEELHDTYETLNEAINSDVDRFGRFIWWDMFCQNQHAAGDVAETFKTAINQVDKVLFSVPNLVRPQALGRVWCLFELTHALLTPTVKLELVNKSRKQHRSYGDPLQYITDVNDATATYLADKDMLLNLMESSIDGGCEAANKAIRELFIPCFVTQCLLDLVIDGQLTEIAALVSKYNMTDLRDVARQDKTTLLHLAAKHGHLDIVIFLLEHNADVKAQNFIESTPLHEASRNGHGPICDMLIVNGANIDALDDDGETPLHVATNIEVVQVLLTYNANPTIENKYDEFTPQVCMRLMGVMGLRGEVSPEMIALVADAESQWCVFSSDDSCGDESDDSCVDESSSSSSSAHK